MNVYKYTNRRTPGVTAHPSNRMRRFCVYVSDEYEAGKAAHRILTEAAGEDEYELCDYGYQTIRESWKTHCQDACGKAESSLL